MSCINMKTLVILSRRKTNIIQEIKGLMNKLCFVLLSRRKTSFYAKLQIIVPLFTGFYMVGPALYCFVRTISKTGSKRVNNELHKCALPRMKTSLLEFIDATVIASS